jgi:hypothetical protein
MPQFARSEAKSTQLVPHSVSPAGHTIRQALATHDSPALHVRPHPPQFIGSVLVSAQYARVVPGSQRVRPPQVVSQIPS